MSIENLKLISIIKEDQSEFETLLASLDSSKLEKNTIDFGTTLDKKTGKVQYFYLAYARV